MMKAAIEKSDENKSAPCGKERPSLMKCANTREVAGQLNMSAIVRTVSAAPCTEPIESGPT